MSMYVYVYTNTYIYFTCALKGDEIDSASVMTATSLCPYTECFDN